MPTQHNKIPIEGLLESYESALTELGYSITSKLLFVKRAGLIIRRHQDKGLVYFNQAIVNQYICEIDESYFKGGMQKKYYDRLRGEVDRFVCYVQSGKGGALPSPLRGAKQKLTPGFERIAEEFIAGDFHPNTRCDIRWVTYKYFGWLEEHGFIDLSGVSAAQIQRFLLDCSEHYAPSTIHDIRLYLKKLYAFLYETGLADDSYSALFSFVVNREKRVFPVLPKSDIAKLLDAIDRTKVKGKRDYAIMLLGTVLGLRACDIVTLKLTDIDWLHGEIRIMQSKTSNPVILPLTQDVGEALKDYILNARPDTADSEIFLRINAPHTRLAAAVTVGEIYRDCCIAAGLPANGSTTCAAHWEHPWWQTAFQSMMLYRYSGTGTSILQSHTLLQIWSISKCVPYPLKGSTRQGVLLNDGIFKRIWRPYIQFSGLPHSPWF